jgi:hypothetical protein
LNALFIVPVRLRIDGVVGDPSSSSISSFVRFVILSVDVVVGNDGGGGSIGFRVVGRDIEVMVVVGVPASAAASPNFFVAVMATLDPESRLSFGGGVLVLPREGVPVLPPVDERFETGGAEAVVEGVFGGRGWACWDID